MRFLWACLMRVLLGPVDRDLQPYVSRCQPLTGPPVSQP